MRVASERKLLHAQRRLHTSSATMLSSSKKLPFRKLTGRRLEPRVPWKLKLIHVKLKQGKLALYHYRFFSPPILGANSQKFGESKRQLCIKTQPLDK